MNLLFILFLSIFSYESLNHNIGLVEGDIEERIPECYTNNTNSIEQNQLMAQLLKDNMGFGAVKDTLDNKSKGVQE